MKTFLKKLCVTSLLLAFAVLPLAAQSNDSAPSPEQTNNSTEIAPPSPASNAPPQAPKAHVPKKSHSGAAPAASGPQLRIDDNGIYISGEPLSGLRTPGQMGFHGPSGYEVILTIAAITIPFVFLTGIVAIIFEARRRKNQELHETLRAMIEKGVPIPPELITPRQSVQPFGNGGPFGNSNKRAKSDLRSGLVWIAVGLGVMIALSSIHAKAWPLGLVLVLTGGAFLLTYKIEKKEDAKSELPPK